MRVSSAIRAAAWGVVAVGVAVPLARRRARIPPPVVTATAATAPLAMCVAVPRSRARDVAVVTLQMWAYVATYQMPNDDPERLRARVRVRYPVVIDRAIGLGRLPGLRLQRALARPEVIGRVDQVLIWSHWLWFLVPHTTAAYLLLRRPALFPRGAAQIYATFDLGLIGYWALPTAPPWYAAQTGALGDTRDPALRRMMIEHGEAFWKGLWRPLYDVLAGNPLAAMPSLHFATSLMSAHLLREAGPVPGVVGWAYAITLGFALVYLGEHYVIDLIAGAALTELVRRGAPRAAPAARALGAVLQRLERAAHA
ncbi:MAG TPA: phosphatase PAP2 family protein [Solirubrobacteraceae bacterium]|nr:phosphatase PAP2 family protein [Solirubrobacteraceae bacterium]